MNTRSNILSKTIVFVLMAALTLVICCPVAATTYSTTLTTTVPESFSLLMELTGEGTVTVNGVVYNKSGTVEIPRHSVVELLIAPDAGNEIKSVIYNGHDYTEKAKAGKITLPAITEDAELCVCFYEIPSTPQPGDTFSLLWLVLLILIALLGLITTLILRKKRVH